MVSKLRKEDEKCANIVADLLDKHLYCQVTNFERCYDVQRQVSGIDTLFTYNDKTYLCDEKAAIRYVNKNLQTFSLELSFINRRNEVQDGWLIDDKKVNNAFLFVWIDKSDKDIISSVDDVKEIEVALVDKSKILSFLERLGWTEEKMLDKAQKMRENESEYGGNVYKHGCKFVCSRFLVEQPVNVLISREDLKKISDWTVKFDL